MENYRTASSNDFNILIDQKEFKHTEWAGTWRLEFRIWEGGFGIGKRNLSNGLGTTLLEGDSCSEMRAEWDRMVAEWESDEEWEPVTD